MTRDAWGWTALEQLGAGRAIRVPGAAPGSPWREVVGVVGDIRHRSLGEPARPAYFVPYAQGLISPLRLVIRHRNTPGIAEEVRKVIARKDPEVALYDVKTMEEYLATSVASPRFQTLLLAVFAGVGLALTAVGLYGVMAYGVAQRTREFGIRLALGARPGEVLGLVMRGGLALVAAGLAAGILAAGFATEVLAGALYGVDRLDPATFLGVARCCWRWRCWPRTCRRAARRASTRFARCGRSDDGSNRRSARLGDGVSAGLQACSGTADLKVQHYAWAKRVSPVSRLLDLLISCPTHRAFGAASSRAASGANAGVGPCHRRSSTESNSVMSVRSVASVRNSSARSRSLASVRARRAGLAAFTLQVRQSSGMASRCPNRASTAAADFAPQPGSPG